MKVQEHKFIPPGMSKGLAATACTAPKIADRTGRGFLVLEHAYLYFRDGKLHHGKKTVSVFGNRVYRKNYRMMAKK
jgi:hypothetical protein